MCIRDRPLVTAGAQHRHDNIRACKKAHNGDAMRRILITAALLAIAGAPEAQARKLGSLDFKACSLSTPLSLIHI